VSRILERARAHIAGLRAYPPGKPIEEVERELGIGEAIKLASNESSLGPSARAVHAVIDAAATLNRYPDGSSFYLREALAKHLGVAPECLLFGAGSDEILELLVKVFVDPGDEVAFYWPSFAMYPIVTQGMGGVSREAHLGDDLGLDVDRLIAQVGPQTKLVFVTNPNNPTGTSLGRDDVVRLIREIPEDVILVMDEAYIEYMRRADPPSTLEWIERRPTLVSLRTFSKIYGLAGLRVGYAVGSAELIGVLERARHPFNVSSVAQAAARAALEDQAHVARVREITHEGLLQLETGFRALDLPYVESDANFVLVEVGDHAARLERDLLERGVIVRPMGAFGLTRHLRVTVGLPGENARFLESLRLTLESL